MKNLAFFIKSIILLIIMAAVGILATGYMASQAQKLVAASVQIHNTDAQGALDVANAKEQVMRALADMLSIGIVSDTKAKATLVSQMNNALDNFNKSMSHAKILVPDYTAQLETLQRQGNALFSNDCARSLQAGGAHAGGNMPPLAQQNCLNAFIPYAAHMTSVRNAMITMSGQKFQGLTARAQQTTWISMILLITSIIIILLLSCWAITIWIARPLNRLRSVMQRLSAGDLSVQVPDTDRRDEVGQMARTVMVFKDNGIERHRIEEIAKKTQEEIDSERTRNESVRAEMSKAQAQVVEALADGLEQLAAGDLEFRIAQNFQESYEKLRLDFNRAIDALQHTMQRIHKNAASVRSNTGEITQSADNLSRRTEQQAASLEEAAASLDEITATVRKASEGASEAKSLANEAKADAERSGNVVEKTVEAMEEIESSSKKISNIIGVIDEIAFQTNLLALNAGVEAARAGDAGRGFAVVATEVRALAQRSADAAKEIKALIMTSGMQVETGVKLVNETGEALGRIVSRVSDLNELVTNIANSSKEQTTALEEVNAAVNQMDQVTQQNAAMVEENTAASYALANEADELSRLVGQFRIGADKQTPNEKQINSDSNKIPSNGLVGDTGLKKENEKHNQLINKNDNKTTNNLIKFDKIKNTISNDTMPEPKNLKQKRYSSKFLVNDGNDWDEF